MVALNFLLGLVALAALVVAARQLRLQRTTAGGRGLLVSAVRFGRTDTYGVEVHIVGPKVWHDLAVHLEKDGREFYPQPEMPDRPATRKTMTCESEWIRWDFDLTPEVGEKAWCLVTWVEPYGPNLRTEALAAPLRGGPLYEWRWRWGHLYIGQMHLWASQHGPAWFRERFGRPRPQGRWRKYRFADGRLGTGPSDLGHAPDA
jgi:hypothetical protein